MKRPWACAVAAVDVDEVMASAASFLVFDVALEGAGRSELPQLVSHHLFSDEHWNVGLAVVNGNGVADHHRQDCGST